MGKVLIVVGALATLAVGMLAADQATSQEYKPSHTDGSKLTSNRV
jgi:hypothetical protein